jgi:hypothetical protein
MDETAGTLEQWATAVKAVRATLGSRQKSALRASNYWKFRVYGREWDGGSYHQTIEMRFAEAGALAPYWSLLDKGNYNEVGIMSSDWGGSPYPTNSATNFTGKVAEKLEEIFRGEIVAQKEALESRVEEIKITIEKLNKYMVELQALLDSFITGGGEVIDLEQPSAIERVQTRYENMNKTVNPTKLAKYVSDLIAGLKVPERPRFGGVRPRKSAILKAIRGG